MPRIIAVGASQGGVTALRSLASALPADFPGALLIVLHVRSGSILPSLLNDVSALHASHAEDGEPIEAGRIYVAPPDAHMLAIDGRLELTHGPRENWARPAIDPLFRSVAESYGDNAVGVVLTGQLNDGTAGLYEIKRRGGTTIVQNPAEAEAPGMPESARRNVKIDFCLKLAEIPPLLDRLAREEKKAAEARSTHGADVMERQQHKSPPVAQTCPECGGAMVEEAIGPLTRFRCHIGHIMTAEVLAASQAEILEANISATLRGLNERFALCRELAARHAANGDTQLAEKWSDAADEALKREEVIQKLDEMSWHHPESAGERD